MSRLIAPTLGVVILVASMSCSIRSNSEPESAAATGLNEAHDTEPDTFDDLFASDDAASVWTYSASVDPLTDAAVENLSVVARDHEYPIGSAAKSAPQLSIACDWEGRLWTRVWFDDTILPRLSSYGSIDRTNVAYRVDRGVVIETLASVDASLSSVWWTDHKTLQLIEKLLDKEELVFVVWDGDGTNRRAAHFPVAGLRENQHYLSQCL